MSAKIRHSPLNTPHQIETETAIILNSDMIALSILIRQDYICFVFFDFIVYLYLSLCVVGNVSENELEDEFEDFR